MSFTETADEMRRLSKLLDKGLAAMRAEGQAFARAENSYRKAKREAWRRAPEGSAKDREAWVDGETADLRMQRDMADMARQDALEAVRSRRGQISALQTMVNADREEAAFARTGPEMAA